MGPDRRLFVGLGPLAWPRTPGHVETSIGAVGTLGLDCPDRLGPIFSDSEVNVKNEAVAG